MARNAPGVTEGRPRCEDCWHFQWAARDYFEGQGGWCRLNPPTRDHRDGTGRSMWPEVRIWDWCGAFSKLNPLTEEHEPKQLTCRE